MLADTSTLTDDRLANVIAEFQRLGLDLAKLYSLIADRDELARRMEANRGALLALRPSSKDYDKESDRLSTTTAALAAQLDQAREAVAAECLTLKYTAAEKPPRALEELRALVKDLDTEIVQSLMRAADLLQERHERTEEHNELAGLVASYAADLRLTPPPAVKTAWGDSWPAWSGVKRTYFERFLKMADTGSWPEPGQELEWFARKRW